MEEVRMLGDTDAIATVGVKDIEVARKFYEGTLGLKLLPADEPSVLDFRSGRSRIMVYQSQYAGTNKATAISWAVGDVKGVVQVLKAKGVVFEHYDFPGMTREGDVHVGGKVKVAWLKDPDGNILSILNG
jgi:catechol 2,3-dioxygenase-like lactoylglutathione lyase family enzyme